MHTIDKFTMFEAANYVALVLKTMHLSKRRQREKNPYFNYHLGLIRLPTNSRFVFGYKK